MSGSFPNPNDPTSWTNAPRLGAYGGIQRVSGAAEDEAHREPAHEGRGGPYPMTQRSTDRQTAFQTERHESPRGEGLGHVRQTSVECARDAVRCAEARASSDVQHGQDFQEDKDEGEEICGGEKGAEQGAWIAAPHPEEHEGSEEVAAEAEDEQGGGQS